MTTPYIICGICYLIAGPFLGGLLSGIDRKFTARMQKRVGPPLLQPFYDVAKLFGKKRTSTNPSERIFVICYLCSQVLGGIVFFMGGNFLLVIFILTLGSLFFILAGFCTRSPFAEEGAMREICQVSAYEPMLLLVAVGYYMATGSFSVGAVTTQTMPVIAMLPLLFIGLVFVLTIKLRKSPFDISTSHHAHQEIVKGITTEMTGSTLGLVEICHWYETVLFLGWVGMFTIWSDPISIAIAVAVAFVVFVLEILIDNNFARVRFQSMLRWCWWVAFICGAVNLSVLPFLSMLSIL